MSGSPECDVIEELEIEDTPLRTVVRIFPSSERARHCLLVYAQKGFIVLKDGGTVLSHWRVKQLLSDAGEFGRSGDLIVALTDTAARKWADGTLEL